MRCGGVNRGFTVAKKSSKTAPKKKRKTSAGTKKGGTKSTPATKAKTKAKALKNKTKGTTKKKAGKKKTAVTTAKSKSDTPKVKSESAAPEAKKSHGAKLNQPRSSAPPAPLVGRAVVVAPATAPPRQPLTDAQLRKAKSGLSRADLEDYRQRLLQKRSELLGDVEALENDARTDSGDHFSPEHMADIGSNNYEQEFTLGLVESEQKLLREIDEALLRIQSRTYGVCIETGSPIGKPRLDAKPWAKYCIDVAREKERLGQL